MDFDLQVHVVKKGSALQVSATADPQVHGFGMVWALVGAWGL